MLLVARFSANSYSSAGISSGLRRRPRLRRGGLKNRIVRSGIAVRFVPVPVSYAPIPGRADGPGLVLLAFVPMPDGADPPVLALYVPVPLPVSAEPTIAPPP
jgi:hypothetical protein